MLSTRFGSNASLVVSSTGKYLTTACLWLVIGMSMIASPLSGCASMSEDQKVRRETQVERLAEWEQACRRSGGVVWSKDGRNPTKTCVSKKSAQQSLARLTRSR